jgi:hypothetical protein
LKKGSDLFKVEYFFSLSWILTETDKKHGKEEQSISHVESQEAKAVHERPTSSGRCGT